MRRRKKEDKTFELIFGISVLIGGFLSIHSIQGVETIQQGIVRVIFTICTVLCCIVGGYFACYFTWIYLSKKYNFKQRFPFPPEEKDSKSSTKRKKKKEFLMPLLSQASNT